MTLTDDWFTEICPESGSAFSLQVKRKLHEERTPFQHIEILETTHFGTLMVIDGFIMLSDRDNFLYHEMMSHPVLFTHPAPERVLIVGGGDCGTLREVLRHPEIKQVTQVEIDERVTRLAERYFPELCEANDDPRATLLFADAIRWVKEAAPGSLDVIIVDSTDPVGPAEGLFSAKFYRDCMRALGDEGVLVHQSESPLIHQDLIRAMRGAMREAGFSRLQTILFPQPVYPSGWWSATMAGKGGPLNLFREEASRNKPFPTRYYNHAIHRAALAMPEFWGEKVDCSTLSR
ncbi:MAG TPA: polyamine aminopropyltransferase [Gammaproteobacteria bacterium]|nr:polyamine aminopropyltransferase [Gammaproteobacteria bacterium]